MKTTLENLICEEAENINPVGTIVVKGTRFDAV